MTKSEFLAKAIQELLGDNISVFLHNKEQLAGGYGGWFEAGDKMELVVAMKHKLSFEIFIHEYCHYLQWRENKEGWEEQTPDYDLLFTWIMHLDKEYSEEQLQKSLETIIRFEHDCESRVLNLAEQLGIEDFDRPKYIRAVNAYLWSYHIAKELRLKSKNTIYTPKIMEVMPDRFVEDVNYYFDPININPQMRQALLTEYQDATEA
jgi:hypothetical protein